MNSSRVFLAAVTVAAIGTSASAQLTGNLLLRQAGTSNNVNQIFGDFPTFSTGMGSLVTSTSAWNISDIQTWQIGNAGNTWVGNVNQARLTVSRQVGGAPDASHDPTAASAGAQIVYSGINAITLDSVSGDNFRIVCDTTGISQLQGLAAGNYVFSLTAIADFGTRGQTFSAFASALGTSTDYIRNPGGGFALPIGTNWGTVSAAFPANPSGTQWAIGINGSPVPEPATMAVLGLGALAMLRRRNKKA